MLPQELNWQIDGSFSLGALSLSVRLSAWIALLLMYPAVRSSGTGLLLDHSCFHNFTLYCPVGESYQPRAFSDNPVWETGARSLWVGFKLKGQFPPNQKYICFLFSSRLFCCELPSSGDISHRDVCLLFNVMKPCDSSTPLTCDGQSTKKIHLKKNQHLSLFLEIIFRLTLTKINKYPIITHQPIHPS